MKLQVLGTGCTKCKKLYELVTQVSQEMGLECEIVKVEKIKEIAAMGVMGTPALAADGKVLFAGSLPSAEKLKEYLKSATSCTPKGA